MRKLRLLGRTEDIPQNRVIAKTRKYMLTIGDAIVHIEQCNGAEGPKSDELWDFVSEFTENSCAGSKLASLYNKLVAKRAATDGTAAEDPTPTQQATAEEAGSAPCNGAAVDPISAAAAAAPRSRSPPVAKAGKSEAAAQNSQEDAPTPRSPAERGRDGNGAGSIDKSECDTGAPDPRNTSVAGVSANKTASAEVMAPSEAEVDEGDADPAEAEELLAAVCGTGGRSAATSTGGDDVFDLSEGDEDDGGEDDNGSDGEWQGD
jgi:hypothetical protein